MTPATTPTAARVARLGAGTTTVATRWANALGQFPGEDTGTVGVYAYRLDGIGRLLLNDAGLWAAQALLAARADEIDAEPQGFTYLDEYGSENGAEVDGTGFAPAGLVEWDAIADAIAALTGPD